MWTADDVNDTPRINNGCESFDPSYLYGIDQLLNYERNASKCVYESLKFLNREVFGQLKDYLIYRHPACIAQNPHYKLAKWARLLRECSLEGQDTQGTMASQTEGAEHLQCVACLQLPSCHIYQCVNGHLICQDCHSKMRRLSSRHQCATCRDPMPGTPIRSLAAEQVVERKI